MALINLLREVEAVLFQHPEGVALDIPGELVDIFIRDDLPLLEPSHDAVPGLEGIKAVIAEDVVIKEPELTEHVLWPLGDRRPSHDAAVLGHLPELGDDLGSLGPGRFDARALVNNQQDIV